MKNIIIKNLCLNSSVGRAKDWKSLWRQFEPAFKQIFIKMKNYLWNIFASIKNGQLVKRDFIYHLKKKNCESFLKILWSEGFISGYSISKKYPKNLKIFLKYKKNKPAINSIKLISKPSRKIHYSNNQLWKLNINKSFIILSTSQGLKTIIDCRKNKLGGEVMLIIK